MLLLVTAIEAEFGRRSPKLLAELLAGVRCIYEHTEREVEQINNRVCWQCGKQATNAQATKIASGQRESETSENVEGNAEDYTRLHNFSSPLMSARLLCPMTALIHSSPEEVRFL